MYTVILAENLRPYSASEITDSMRERAKTGRLTILDNERKRFIGRWGRWEEFEEWKESPQNTETPPYRGITL